MTQPTSSASAFDLLPQSARDLAALIGDEEALRLIGKLCEAARRSLIIRQTVKAARQKGYGVYHAVNRLAFIHGLPVCCVWRIAEEPAQALRDGQP